MDQRPAVGTLRHVGSDIACGDPVPGTQITGEVVILGPVGEAVQNDVGSGRGEGFGDAEPDAGVRSRDHRAFALERHVTSFPFCMRERMARRAEKGKPEAEKQKNAGAKPALSL